jgi:hypothetical protein
VHRILFQYEATKKGRIIERNNSGYWFSRWFYGFERFSASQTKQNRTTERSVKCHFVPFRDDLHAKQNVYPMEANKLSVVNARYFVESSACRCQLRIKSREIATRSQSEFANITQIRSRRQRVKCTMALTWTMIYRFSAFCLCFWVFRQVNYGFFWSILGLQRTSKCSNF